MIPGSPSGVIGSVRRDTKVRGPQHIRRPRLPRQAGSRAVVPTRKPSLASWPHPTGSLARYATQWRRMGVEHPRGCITRFGRCTIEPAHAHDVEIAIRIP